MRPARAILLVGSAKPAGESTSEALGRHLLDRLAEGDVTTSIVRVSHARRDDAERRLLEEVDASDLFVLSAPLYVDALPYLVTRALERIAARRAERSDPPPGRFAAILNCGFPESRHTRTALDIARAFARRAGLEWAGGLGLGGGEAIGGRPLASVGRMGRNASRALDLAADALLEGRSIPLEAVDRMAKPLVPGRLYTAIAGRRWRRAAARHGVGDRLDARPLVGE